MDFVKHHCPQAVPQVQSTLAKLELCRTDVMGGHKYWCDPCDFECRVNNSCGDRHCPQCAGAKRADWLASTSQLLLPGITYFQVVFTIPDTLSSLALGNREEMYDLLFRTAWKTLKSVIADEQQFEPVNGYKQLNQLAVWPTPGQRQIQRGVAVFQLVLADCTASQWFGKGVGNRSAR